MPSARPIFVMMRLPSATSYFTWSRVMTCFYSSPSLARFPPRKALLFLDCRANAELRSSSKIGSIIGSLMPHDSSAIAAEIRRLGRAFNPEILKATYALYAPLQERAQKDGVDAHKDIAYGEDVRHRLDRKS